MEFPQVWDSTMREAFVECPRKCYYSFLEGLAPSDVSIHLHFGGALAAGLETVRRSYYFEGVPPQAALARGLRRLISEWGDVPDDLHPTKTLWRCARALIDYFEHWPLGGDHLVPVRLADGGVEFSFAIEIPEVAHPESGEPLIYAGRLDMLAEYAGQLVVEDDKTTSRMGPTWTDQWRLRGQFTGYCYAARQYGFHVIGAAVRGICIRTRDNAFAEHITQRPQHLIDAWYDQLVRDLRRAVTAYVEGHWDAAFSSACAAYSGCAFLDLCCAAEPERWYDNFARRQWNPLTRD